MPLGAFKLNSIARYIVPYTPPGGGGTTLDAVELTYSTDDYTTTAFATSSDFVASNKITASAWIRVPDFTNRKCIFNIRTNQAPLLFVVNTDGSTRLLAGNGSAGYFLDARTAAGTIASTNTWYHIAISVDTSDTAKRWQYINGVAVGSPIWTTYNTNTTWLVANASGYLASIGRNPDGGLVGGEAGMDVAQVWIDNSYIDLSTNISKFYNGGAVDMGASGTSSGLPQPLIYHYGNTTSSPTFQTNRGRTGANSVSYTFTVNGTPSDTVGPTGTGGAAPPTTTYYVAGGGTVSPYVEIYKVAADSYTKLANPDTLPTGGVNGLEFSPNGDYLAVAHATAPYLTIYKRNGDAFTKLSNPATLPTSTCWDIAWDPSSDILYVSSSATPYFLAYSRSGDTFTKIADPSYIPDTEVRGIHTDSTGNYVAMCPRTSITANLVVYKRSGTTFTPVVKSLDASGRTLYCDFSPSGEHLSVGLENSPWLRIYKRNADAFSAIPSPFAGSTLAPSGNTRSAIFSPDGNYMVIQQQVVPYNIIFKRNGDTWQSLTSSSDVGTWNGDGANWDDTSTYLTLTGGSTPFIKTYKRTGDTFTAIANPGVLPSGILRDGGWYPGPFTNVGTSTLASWNTFSSGNTTNKYSISTDFNIGNIVAMDDTYGIINYATNADVNTIRTKTYTRTGGTISLGTESSRAFTRGTDRTYTAVKMGDYAVVIANYGKSIIAAQWTGGTSFAWGTEQLFSALTASDRISSFAVTDTCLMVAGSNGVRLFSRSGGTFTHRLDSTWTGVTNATYTQIIPLQDPFKYVAMLSDGVANTANAVVFTVDPFNYTVSFGSYLGTFGGDYYIDTNAFFRVGQTSTTERLGNTGIFAFSKYVANYQYIDLMPFSVSGNTITKYTSNVLQITDNTPGDDRPWSFDILKLSEEWYIVHNAAFDDSGLTPSQSRMFHLIKYDTTNNTLSEVYKWNVAPDGGIVSIRNWITQINKDYLIFIANEGTSNASALAYVVPRTV